MLAGNRRKASSSDAIASAILARRELALDLQMPPGLAPARRWRSRRRPLAGTRRSARFETASRLLPDRRRRAAGDAGEPARPEKSERTPEGCTVPLRVVNPCAEQRTALVTRACSPSVPKSRAMQRDETINDYSPAANRNAKTFRDAPEAVTMFAGGTVVDKIGRVRRW